ncbi:MAG: hypothetical protein ISR83_07710 [Candidatus Marinimicrobia bacterium]|nr:hypothetical protein [Candidatus Neomarinimicrobiota bacterium]
MSINFDNKESRVDYLTGKFTDLLDGINGSYGQALIDELMNRLDQTIIDFNDEVEQMMDELKGNGDKRSQLLHSIISSEKNPGVAAKPSTEEESVEPSSESTAELSDWEKRLEALDK